MAGRLLSRTSPHAIGRGIAADLAALLPSALAQVFGG